MGVELGVGHELGDLLEAVEDALGNGGGVRAVEEAHLARAVGRHVRGVDDIHSGAGEGQLGLEVERRAVHDGHLHYEEVERLAADERIVRLAEALGVADGGLGVWPAGHDAVHESGAEDALALYPLGEGGVAHVGDVLEHAFLESVSVMLDELAGDEYEARLAGGEAR